MAKKLKVFDPPLCCPTGVCGPSTDPVLVRLAADLGWLETQGVEVTRHNLAQEPQAFAADPVVAAALRDEGNVCLPLILSGGEIVSRSRYPDRAELAVLAGLDPSSVTAESPSGTSLEMAPPACDPATGCCEG